MVNPHGPGLLWPGLFHAADWLPTLLCAAGADPVKETTGELGRKFNGGETGANPGNVGKTWEKYGKIWENMGKYMGDYTINGRL